MAGYGSPPPPDQGNNPNRQVGPTTWSNPSEGSAPTQPSGGVERSPGTSTADA